MTDNFSKTVSDLLVGKKIISAKVTGHYVELTLNNGYLFEYHASDGGLSLFGIIKADNS